MAFLVALVVAQQGNCRVIGHHQYSADEILHDGGFIQRNGTHFILNGKPHYFKGFNAYWLMYMASDSSTMSKVTSTFQQASQHGLNVVRTWAFSDGGYRALQFSPCSYDENVFRVLHLHFNSYLFKYYSQVIYIHMYII